MLGELHAVESAVTKDYVLKIWNERVFDSNSIALGLPVPWGLRITTAVVLQAIRKATRAISNSPMRFPHLRFLTSQHEFELQYLMGIAAVLSFCDRL